MANKIKVTWLWADGRKDSLFVSRGILGQVVELLDKDNRLYGGQVDGMTYAQYVHIFGGTVLSDLRSF